MVGEPAIVAEHEITLATLTHVTIVVHNGPIVAFRSGTVLDVPHSVQCNFQQYLIQLPEHFIVEQFLNLQIISSKF